MRWRRHLGHEAAAAGEATAEHRDKGEAALVEEEHELAEVEGLLGLGRRAGHAHGRRGLAPELGEAGGVRGRGHHGPVPEEREVRPPPDRGQGAHQPLHRVGVLRHLARRAAGGARRGGGGGR